MTDDSRPRVCLTFDFDALSIWLRMFDTPTASGIARGEFGARIGTPRILDLLAREEVPGTFFTPGHTVETFPDVCRRIVADGHELAHHGHFHLDTCGLDEQGARTELEQGFEAIDRVLGVRPRGYRAPGGDLSLDMIALLVEYGFDYDSSLMAQDLLPYYPRVGDLPHRERPFEFGTEVDLVELPCLVSLIDVPQMEFLLRPPVPGLHANRKILEMWCEELDWMCDRNPGAVFTLVLHPSTIPRGARFAVLEGLIRHAKERDAVFVTSADAAAEWRRRHPFPVVGSDGRPG